MKQNKQEIFENVKPSKAVWTLVLPTIIGMFVMEFYNIVDTYFIAQTNDLIQIVAVSHAMPVFMILVGLGNLFGIGASSNISRNLGSKNLDIIKNISATAFYLAIVTGIIFGGICLMEMKELTLFLGVNELNTEYVGGGYLTLIVIGAPFIITASVLFHIIRSEGNAKTAMFGMLFGAIVNIVCNPIFIFGLDMGALGAALATVVANVVAILFYVTMILKNNDTAINLSFKNIMMKNKVFINIVTIGMPALVISLLASRSTFLYNWHLNPYGDEAVAAMEIVMKISMLYTAIFMGIAIGVQPLLGYCYGSKKEERFKESLFYTLKVSVIVGIVFLGYTYVASGNTIAGAIYDPLIISYETQMLKAQIITAPIVGIVYISMSTMQSTGGSLLAMILSLSRQGIAFIPTIFILANILGFKGIIWAQPIADVLTLVLAVIGIQNLLKSFGSKV